MAPQRKSKADTAASAPVRTNPKPWDGIAAKPPMLRPAKVQAALGLSRSSFYDMVGRGDLPPPAEDRRQGERHAKRVARRVLGGRRVQGPRTAGGGVMLRDDLLSSTCLKQPFDYWGTLDAALRSSKEREERERLCSLASDLAGWEIIQDLPSRALAPFARGVLLGMNGREPRGRSRRGTLRALGSQLEVKQRKGETIPRTLWELIQEDPTSKT